MKELNKKNMVIAIILAIIVIAGIIVIAIKGFNTELEMQNTNFMQINLKKEFKNSDIKQIVKEILGNKKIAIHKVEEYEDTVRIIAKEVTEEQKNEIINKINEKYELEVKAEEIDINTIPQEEIIDFVKPYILPIVIVQILILLYMIIRYKAIGVLTVLIKTIGIVAIAEALLISIIGITRIPVGRYTISMVLVVYVATIIGLTTNFERKLEIKNQEK